MKNYLILSKLKQRKTRIRFYEDRPFKEGDKMLCSSRIKEAVEEQNLYHLVSKLKKPKAPNMKDIKDVIICKVLK